jgi:predicted nucleic acid-binding protein
MLLVGDANIFIDFAATELTPLLFRLDDELLVPDILYEEELAAVHSHLLELGLQTRPMTGEHVDQAMQLQKKYSGPSTNDLLALTLAQSIACPLVSGDRRLRTAAQAEGVEVIGTLALVGRLVERNLINVDQAEQAYTAMKKANRRLPWTEVEAQLAAMRAAQI